MINTDRIPALFHTIIYKLPVLQGHIIDDGNAFVWDSGKYYLKVLKAGGTKQYICTGCEATPIGYAVPQEWEDA